MTHPRAAALTAAVLAAGLTGCTTTPAPALPAAADSAPTQRSGPVTISRGFDPAVDYRDPAAVCRAFTAAMYSADTCHDQGPGAAAERASAYTDIELAAQSPASVRDGRWETWVAHHARLVVSLAEYEDLHQPPDSSIEAYRATRVTATPVGDDGWRGWTERSIVYCTLSPGSSGWRVTRYEIQPDPWTAAGEAVP